MALPKAVFPRWFQTLKWTTNVNYRKYLLKVFIVNSLGSSHANICVGMLLRKRVAVETGKPILSGHRSLTMSSTRSGKQLLNFCFDTEIVALAVTVGRTGSGQLFCLPSDFNCLTCCEDPPTGVTVLTLPKSLEISYLKFTSSQEMPPVELVLVWYL